VERVPVRSALFGILTLVLAACAGSTAAVGTGADTSVTTEPPPLAAPSLLEFDSCDSLLDYVTSNAVDRVGPYGLEDPFTGWWRGAAVEGADTDSLAGQQSGSPEYSGTNVQVLGVDEPDIVKTDGERIVVLAEGSLLIADVTGTEPVVTGRLHLDRLSVQNLFLSGDRVLLFGSAWQQFHPLGAVEDASFAPVHQSPSIELIEVDISGDPEIVRTMTIDGQFVSGRMVGDTVRLVSTSAPVGFEWSFPTGNGLQAERQATEENREIIRRSGPSNWIPYYVVTDADGDVTDEGTLFDCNRAAHPARFSGFNMLSVVTIGLSEGLSRVDATGVLANGSTVYSSDENLYVATQGWEVLQWGREGLTDDRPESVTTEIHKFDISDRTGAHYRSTGSVDGYLLNQFAMDEHEGLLRVASTTAPLGWGGGTDSESLVTVLEDDGSSRMKEIGRVDGLGETEQIYSVRFIDDLAYVVTFRQTDPLYTVDLSDPAHPSVVGELKILGYSAYLHPVGDGLLLGVGQDATEEGGVKGTQVSLFDVSDPANPIRLDQVTLSEGSSSQVEYDHHAFLYWQPRGLAVVPIQQWWSDKDKAEVFFGAVGLAVEGTSLQEVSRIAHPGGASESWDGRSQIVRSLIVGDYLYTISTKGVLKSSLDSLEEVDFVGF
jgi:uncharacterized secreted protein with C-terminal beta-propeller domain